MRRCRGVQAERTAAMSDGGTPKYLDVNQVIFLPRWARFAVMAVLGALALSACVVAISFFWFQDYYDQITPALSIAQTAAGAFAIIVFVLVAERQLNVKTLL